MHSFHYHDRHLYCEDVDLARVAKERGTPTYVYSAGTILDHYTRLDAALAPLDHLICYAVKANSKHAILNLAAGFDTRPYRLALPEGLRWVEADLPELIAEKEQLLADEKPRCRLERVAVDLADASARAAFLERYTEGAHRVAVISEGLVIYLEPSAVAELGRALLA